MKPFVTAASIVLAVFMAVPALTWSTGARAQQLQAREGWYKALADHAFVRQHVDIPPKKGVLLIDSRPAARQFDPAHIPGAINIPDTRFEKLAGALPADRTTLLIFYCGGPECMLSHNSAAKAEKLGYTNIKVYAAGMPEWKAKGGPTSVSAAYLKKLMDEKAPYVLVDARPKRVADKGKIPTALNISDTEFDRHLDKLPADKATPLIYYCGGLECVLSDRSAEKARKLGYGNVQTYPEGYPEWEKLHGGMAAAGAPAAGAPGTGARAVALLEPGKEKGSVTLASLEKAWQENPSSLLLVDVRDAKEFAAGTLKGAASIPMNELEKRLATLPTDKPVVFVCGTGARAGEAYDTVKLLRGEVNAFFVDVALRFNPDGSFPATQN